MNCVTLAEFASASDKPFDGREVGNEVERIRVRAGRGAGGA